MTAAAIDRGRQRRVPLHPVDRLQGQIPRGELPRLVGEEPGVVIGVDDLIVVGHATARSTAAPAGLARGGSAAAAGRSAVRPDTDEQRDDDQRGADQDAGDRQAEDRPDASRCPVLAPLPPLATDFAPSLMPTSTMQIARIVPPRICSDVPHCATQALT